MEDKNGDVKEAIKSCNTIEKLLSKSTDERSYTTVQHEHTLIDLWEHIMFDIDEYTRINKNGYIRVNRHKYTQCSTNTPSQFVTKHQSTLFDWGSTRIK